MSEKVVTISKTAGLPQAVALMKEFDIRHLPVVNGEKRLIGLVTEGDVRGAIFPAMIEDLTIHDLMVSDPITVDPDTMLEDAARIIYRNKIGCLPVVGKDGVLHGIVTVADMLGALIELMGFLSGSSRLDVVLPDRADALEEAVHIIRAEGGNIIGISLTRVGQDRPVHLFRLQKTELKPIVDRLAGGGFSVVSSMD